MHTEQHASTDAVLERTFSCALDQVRVARRWAADVYAGAGAGPDATDICSLLVSEVVTNAVVHAGGDQFLVRIRQADLRIEVWDGSPELPKRQTAGPTSESGRGMELLELLAPGYEVVRGRRGKGVCFSPTIALQPEGEVRDVSSAALISTQPL